VLCSISALWLAQAGVVVAVGGSVTWYWVVVARDGARRERAVMRRHARTLKAHYAAVEAAEDNPDFSPEAITQYVSTVVEFVDVLWRTGTCGALDGSPDERLVRAWARSRKAWLGDDPEVTRKPSVGVLRVVNRDDPSEDRVDVRVRIPIHCKHPRIGLLATRFVHLDERWTIGRARGDWVLISMGGNPLAGPLLTAPLVPNPSYDTQRLLEESLVEQSNLQTVGSDTRLSDLVGANEPPSLALLDLSVLDPRFDPTLIAAELAHLLEAWEEAVFGSEAPFEELASDQAVKALLKPREGMRLIMRDAELKSWEPTRLVLDEQPPRIEVALQVDAVLYLATDSNRHVAADRADIRHMSLSWVLELADSSASTPWRLAQSNNPAEEIPGWA
jgi:hypothetical protein